MEFCLSDLKGEEQHTEGIFSNRSGVMIFLPVVEGFFWPLKI